MHKYVIYFSLLCIYLTEITYADTYNIKLASYSNKDNLLQKVNYLDPSLQKNLILIKKDHLYKLFSPTIYKKDQAIELLTLYKKIFPDAYIKKDCQIAIQKKTIGLSSSLSSESNQSTPLPSITKSTKIIQPIPPTTDIKHNLYQILANQTYFLCPNTIHSKSEKLLLQADFNTTDANFTTLIGKVPPLSMPYLIQKNRLYFVNNGHVSPSQFNTLTKVYFEYMIVSRWMKGKRIHQMRYYKKEEDARSYLESIDIQ